MCTVATMPTPKLRSIPAQSPLPIQAIPRTISSRIEDPKGKLIAVGGLVRYSTNQAYFILQHLDAEFARGKAVFVGAPDEEAPHNLKITAIHDSIPDRTHMRMYFQVHWNPEERPVIEHLIDSLAESALGARNLELKKNITIDMFDSGEDAFLRDRAGFIVSDRLRLCQITIDACQLMKHTHGASANVVVEEVTSAEKREELLTYDTTLSSYNRADFLEFLFSKTKVYLARSVVANENGLDRKGEEETSDTAPTIAGYIVAGSHDQRVMALYAESQSVAEALMEHHVKASKAKMVTFCASKCHWRELEKESSFRSRPVIRRHTRAVPPNVKWEKVFAINVGMNLF